MTGLAPAAPTPLTCVAWSQLGHLHVCTNPIIAQSESKAKWTGFQLTVLTSESILTVLTVKCNLFVQRALTPHVQYMPVHSLQLLFT